jgi:hypothetical protein
MCQELGNEAPCPETFLALPQFDLHPPETYTNVSFPEPHVRASQHRSGNMALIQGVTSQVGAVELVAVSGES